GDLDIEGNNKILTSTTSASGIKTSTYTLTVSNIREYSGFEDAITVQEGGSLEVEKVTFMNNRGEAVIRSSGSVTLTDVRFSGNVADIDVANDGELNIEGTSVLEKGINGEGKTEIGSGATLENGAGSTIRQSSITVAGVLTNNNSNASAIEATEQLEVVSGGLLKTEAGAVKADKGIANAGNIEFTGGTNTNKISGEGYLITSGDLTNNANITQSSVTVKSGKFENNGEIVTTGEGIGIVRGATLTTHNLLDTYTNNGKIANEGTLEISVSGDAQSANIIDGTGQLLISNGRFDNEYNGTLGKINQSSITIGSGAVLTSSASAITTSDKITNNGTIIFYDGTNNNEIIGEGVLRTSGTVDNAANISQEEVEVVRGTLTNKEGKTITATTVTNKANAEIVNSGEVNATNITNEADAAIGNSGTINVSNELLNGGAINNESAGNIEVGTLTNSGAINSTGTITATNIVNNEGATVINNEGGAISADGITNRGSVTNDGMLSATAIANEATGVISNEGTINSVNAITNKGTITSKAEDINITGATKEISNDGGTYNVTGGVLSGYDVIGTSTGTSKVNILGEVEIGADRRISSNTVSVGDGETAGSLKLGADNNLANSTLVIEAGSILITDNGSANDIEATVNIAEGAKWRYELDVDLEAGEADRLNVGAVGGGSSATISSIHINKDKASKTSVEIANADINAGVLSDIHIYTTNLKYKVESRVEGGRTVLDIVADGSGGLAGAVYDGALSYSITEGVDYLTAWIEEGGKTYDKLSGDLDIEGNNKILTSTTSASGIKTSTYTLTVSNI
ncbi:MAG: hypothetical protein J5725_09945, partial [Bacteroidales bacterium]|nr:hypothetical protein [Bacteroidales bacterium]